MQFGLRPAGWAYVPPYAYTYVGLPYSVWPWWGGWGRRWGWGWPGYWGAIPYGWPWAPMPKEQEIAMLEDGARWLERDLDSIRKRLEELRK